MKLSKRSPTPLPAWRGEKRIRRRTYAAGCHGLLPQRHPGRNRRTRPRPHPGRYVGAEAVEDDDEKLIARTRK